MSVRRLSLSATGLVLTAPLWGKSKEEKTLPTYVLTAHTVAVMVDPQAGIDVEDPRANQIAQKDVETALANWGRYEMVMRPEAADLVIVIRKGHSRLVDGDDPRCAPEQPCRSDQPDRQRDSDWGSARAASECAGRFAGRAGYKSGSRGLSRTRIHRWR